MIAGAAGAVACLVVFKIMRAGSGGLQEGTADEVTQGGVLIAAVMAGALAGGGFAGPAPRSSAR